MSIEYICPKTDVSLFNYLVKPFLKRAGSKFSQYLHKKFKHLQYSIRKMANLWIKLKEFFRLMNNQRHSLIKRCQKL